MEGKKSTGNPPLSRAKLKNKLLYDIVRSMCVGLPQESNGGDDGGQSGGDTDGGGGSTPPTTPLLSGDNSDSASIGS